MTIDKLELKLAMLQEDQQLMANSFTLNKIT